VDFEIGSGMATCFLNATKIGYDEESESEDYEIVGKGSVQEVVNVPWLEAKMIVDQLKVILIDCVKMISPAAWILPPCQ
jgi:hypothetical protein